MEQDKINAYMTLYTALVTVSKLSAPMIPFMTESIYQNIVRSSDANAPESIHLCDYPKADESYINKELEEKMETVLDAVVLGRACRNEGSVKNRQPIPKMYIKSEERLDAFYTDIIKEELNVKEVVFADDVREFTTYIFKPQLKTVGPKYGKQLGGIQKVLKEIDGNKAMDELEAAGVLKFDVDGNAIELSKDDLLIEMTKKEGFEASEDHGMTVVLDLNLTDELIEEGFAAELVSKVQTMRKDSGFEVMDHILISLNGNEKLLGIVRKNEAQIATKLLADEINSGETYDFTKEWDINGEKVTISVKKK